MNANNLLRSFATALAFILVTGMAGAQCSHADLSATAEKPLLHTPFGASGQPAISAIKQPAAAGMVKTSAHSGPAIKTSALSGPAAGATAAPRARALNSDTQTSRPGSAALYAALALMAAIALRRFGR